MNGGARAPRRIAESCDCVVRLPDEDRHVDGNKREPVPPERAASCDCVVERVEKRHCVGTHQVEPGAPCGKRAPPERMNEHNRREPRKEHAHVRERCGERVLSPDETNYTEALAEPALLPAQLLDEELTHRRRREGVRTRPRLVDDAVVTQDSVRQRSIVAVGCLAAEKPLRLPLWENVQENRVAVGRKKTRSAGHRPEEGLRALDYSEGDVVTHLL